ncbi:cytochrome P450 CYP82D47-like isoform X2 [Olea europaea var. sylvestris]|nr:cytochrome P450 CYP82D47-like isoform X2 [Olea europaea var. sylvestris]
MELAKECFTTNDVTFSNRPKTVALHHMSYNLAMFPFNEYGPYWRDLRKISMLKLLSSQRVAKLRDVYESEVKAMISSVYVSYGMPIDMKNYFGELTLNLMVRIIAGNIEKKIDLFERDKWQKEIREFFQKIGRFTLSDVRPFLKWLDFEGLENDMKKTAKAMDSLLQTWLEDHKRKKNSAINGANNEQMDFMGELLRVIDSVAVEFPEFDADTIIKATCQTMMLAGTDTMSVTLTWTLSLLLNNRHTLRKAQEELDLHVSRGRQVQESDVNNLIYIQAIIKETLRLYPPAQTPPPRESLKDCIVGGYHIPKSTHLYVNLWKIHRDPVVWPNPLEFRPERFITTHKELDVRGQHFEFLPFGSGRRMCPGIGFALQIVTFTLASLLHGFDISTPSDEAVDMTGIFGLTNPKATPLEVVFTPRLSPLLYG